MFKRIYLLFIICCCIQPAVHAQKTANQWYFGKNIGLNFNQSPPQKLFNGNLSSIEGCASIADANGNLLFYTNGVSVMTKNHTQMVNGDGIMGHLSSTNNAVIVPLPESDSIYYLFTVGASGQLENGLKYTIINTRKQNGAGEVIEKNNILHTNTYEKLAAVRHCNRKDVWITVKDWNSDAYYTYLLTKNGVNPVPVISNMGTVIGVDPLNALGTLKFSSDGKKLVAIHSFDNDAAQLMKFDNQTGVLSDPIWFRPNVVPGSDVYVGVYGAEFSPDNRLLYISSRKINEEKSVLYQFDVSVHDEPTITNSKFVVATNNKWDAGGLQRAPDGKIYFSQWRDTALSVINNPNNAGAACNYQYNTIGFPGSTEPVQYGLPTFIASDLDSNYSPYDFSWSRTGCNSVTVNFLPSRTTGFDSVKWYISDGAYYETITPQHTFSQPGSYDVIFEVYKQDCGALSEKILHKVTIGLQDDLEDFLPGDTTFCSAVDYTILPEISSDNYTWNTGATTNELTVNAPGIYWLEINKNGCLYRDSITISQQPLLQLDLGPDKAVCVNKPVQLSAFSNQPVTYKWSTGSTNATIEVNRADTYWVEVSTADGCTVSDTLRTFWGDCDMYIPSAFSPNGDGRNETFGLVNGISTSVFTFYIFNRYGQLVFTTKDPFKKWDGKFKNKPCVSGMYVWMMTYKNKEGFIQTDKGSVMLIR